MMLVVSDGGQEDGKRYPWVDCRRESLGKQSLPPRGGRIVKELDGLPEDEARWSTEKLRLMAILR